MSDNVKEKEGYIEFEYNSDNDVTNMKIYHDTDHGNPKHHDVPHVHDISGSTPSDNINSGWGSGRSLTDDEKERFDKIKEFGD